MAIASVNQLVATIRGQLAASPVRNAARRHAPGKTASPYEGPNLEGLIAERIKQIDRDAPNRGKKAFRVFLEAVLLSQMGEHLINDPKFYHMLDDVQNAIENNPDTRQLMDQATAQLLESC